MNIRITRSAAMVLTVVCLAAVNLLCRQHLLGEAMAQSQEKAQKWEYYYVSSPLQTGSSGKITWKVFVSQGDEKWVADSDSTGVSALNKLGAEGWELVSASDELPYPGTIQLVLPR